MKEKTIFLACEGGKYPRLPGKGLPYKKDGFALEMLKRIPKTWGIKTVLWTLLEIVFTPKRHQQLISCHIFSARISDTTKAPTVDFLRRLLVFT